MHIFFQVMDVVPTATYIWYCEFLPFPFTFSFALGFILLLLCCCFVFS